MCRRRLLQRIKTRRRDPKPHARRDQYNTAAIARGPAAAHGQDAPTAPALRRARSQRSGERVLGATARTPSALPRTRSPRTAKSDLGATAPANNGASAADAAQKGFSGRAVERPYSERNEE